MGKRGPKPADEFGDQKAVLSTRITQETREALERAADANGRTVSREVENRLRRTFSEDKAIEAQFGGRQTYAMMRMIASTMTFAGTAHTIVPDDDALAAGQDKRWLSDPNAYDRAFWATVAVLEAMRPPDPEGQLSSDPGWIERRRNYGFGFAKVVMDQVAKAEPIFASPDKKLSEPERIYRRMANDLGPEGRERLKESDNGKG